jgi:lysozyme
MNEEYTLSPEGAQLVKRFESCLRPAGDVFVPYICPAGVLTIGWGHTNDHGRRFDRNTRWTQEECDAAFDEDMAHFEAAVGRLVSVRLTQRQFDALVSFSYNCGETALARSTLLRKVNARDFEGAAREFPKWNRGGGQILRGLVRRRAAEALLFQEINVQAPEQHEPMPQLVDPPQPPKGMLNSKTGWAAGIPGAAGAGEILAQAKEYTDQAHDIVHSLGLWDTVQRIISNPGLLVAIALIAAGAFIWYDRRRKLHEENV